MTLPPMTVPAAWLGRCGPIAAGVPVGTIGYTPETGYERRACPLCGVEAWLGPRQLALIRDDATIRYACALCIIRLQGGELRPEDVVILDPAADSTFDAEAHRKGGAA